MKFGDYEKVEEIGHGASGYVYKVEKEGTYYALKACTGFDNESIRRFDREIRIAQTLSHPNIVQVYEHDMNASNPYFVMELCDGIIGHVINGKSFDELLDYSIQICEGVKVLHAVGILHRDIKPGNILMKGGTVKLTDFSFGFFTDHDSLTLTTTNQLIGTEGYIAPEIYRQGGHYATKLSDIFSIGCTLWYLFSGGIDPNYYDPQYADPRIIRVIEKCRNNDPARRYQSIQELLDELNALKQPLQYLSISDLLADSQSLSKAEIRANAYRLLMKNTRWDELISDIRLLKSDRLKDIIHNETDAAANLLLLLENIYHNDTDNWKQFADVETFTSLCAQIFNYTNSLLAKQKAIDLTLEFSIIYNRYPAMRIIRKEMLNNLKDEEIRQMSGYLRANKDNLLALEESIGERLNRSVHIAAGIE